MIMDYDDTYGVPMNDYDYDIYSGEPRDIKLRAKPFPTYNHFCDSILHILDDLTIYYADEDVILSDFIHENIQVSDIRELQEEIGAVIHKWAKKKTLDGIVWKITE